MKQYINELIRIIGYYEQLKINDNRYKYCKNELKLIRSVYNGRQKTNSISVNR